jgi:hypothetical protein
VHLDLIMLGLRPLEGCPQPVDDDDDADDDSDAFCCRARSTFRLRWSPRRAWWCVVVVVRSRWTTA